MQLASLIFWIKLLSLILIRFKNYLFKDKIILIFIKINMNQKLHKSILWIFILGTLLGWFFVQCSGYTLGTLTTTSWNPVGVVLDDQTTWYWDPSRCKYLMLDFDESINFLTSITSDLLNYSVKYVHFFKK